MPIHCATRLKIGAWTFTGTLDKFLGVFPAQRASLILSGRGLSSHLFEA
jgi:hypothetical protein